MKPLCKKIYIEKIIEIVVLIIGVVFDVVFITISCVDNIISRVCVCIVNGVLTVCDLKPPLLSFHQNAQKSHPAAPKRVTR